jgi:hypothetical protein
MLSRRESARDDDELVRYLLGELSDEDAERLDERSLADDDFAARLRLVEDDLVDAYAAGRLAGERLKRFESFYLASPRRREKTAFAKRLLQTVEREALRRESDRAATAQRGNRVWFPLAAAAAVALCLLSGWLLVRDARIRTALYDAQQRVAAADRRAGELSTQLAGEQQAAAAARASLADARAAQPASTVALVLLPQTRGVGPVPIVAVGRDGAVPIELAIDAADRASFEAALRDPATNAIVWRSGPIAAVRSRPAPLLAVSVPASILKSQHYTIDVFARRGGGTGDFVGSYAFEVVRR